MLPAFESGGKGLVWTWFATAWSTEFFWYRFCCASRAWPPSRFHALGGDYVGATSIVLSVVGFLRWVFVVPPLADSFVGRDAATQAAVTAAWTAQHQFGGALLCEYLGQLFPVVWSGR